MQSIFFQFMRTSAPRVNEGCIQSLTLEGIDCKLVKAYETEQAHRFVGFWEEVQCKIVKYICL